MKKGQTLGCIMLITHARSNVFLRKVQNLNMNFNRRDQIREPKDFNFPKAVSYFLISTLL